jgi:hypothetical protein
MKMNLPMRQNNEIAVILFRLLQQMTESAN